MSLAYIGEKTFLEEIGNAGQVWVARGKHKNLFALEIENFSYSLPTWSSEEKIDIYLKATLLWQWYAPHAIPLSEFTNRWLSDKMLAISEVQVNPVGKSSRVLALTAEEFKEKIAAA